MNRKKGRELLLYVYWGYPLIISLLIFFSYFFFQINIFQKYHYIKFSNRWIVNTFPITRKARDSHRIYIYICSKVRVYAASDLKITLNFAAAALLTGAAMVPNLGFWFLSKSFRSISDSPFCFQIISKKNRHEICKYLFQGISFLRKLVLHFVGIRVRVLV